MIKTFKDAEAQKIYQRERSRKLPADIQQVALRKLRMINNAININDLRVPPQIDSKNLVAIEKDNLVFVLTINGEFALIGVAVTHLMLRLQITIRRSKNA